MSKAQKRARQGFQNRVIRSCTSRLEEDRNSSIEELHHKYKIEAINYRTHRLAEKTWSKLQLEKPDLTEYSEAMDIEERRDHNWWRRISPTVTADPPDPVYLYDR